MPTVPLLPLLRELLNGQVRQEDRDRAEAEVKRAAGRQEVLARREDLRAQALARGVVLTDLDAEAQAACDVDKRARREAEERGELPLVHRTPWNQALSRLWAALTVPLADERDSDCLLPDEATADESALREYLCRVRKGAVGETSRSSIALARLDREGFGDRLAEMLRQEFPEQMPNILAALPAAPPPPAGETPPPPAPAGSGPQESAAPPAPEIDLEAQGLALLFQQPDWSVAQIADSLGVDRKTPYKWEKFRQAAELKGLLKPRGPKAGSPRGHKTRDGHVEAYTDDE